MPYWAVEYGIEFLRQKLLQLFEEEKLEYKHLEVFGSPRRLAVLAEVSPRQGDKLVEIKGPAYKVAFDDEGRPTQAAIGFAKSQGVSVESLLVKEVGNGKYVFAVKRVEGKDTAEFLKESIPQLISQFNFKKSMRWGSGSFSFVRPIRWIVSLLDDEVIEFEIAGIKSSRVTRGHRILGKEEIEIKNASDYIKILENEGRVIVDHTKRKEEIVHKASKAAEEIGGKAYISEETLNEVLYLVEWPSVIVGRFDDDFLKLPSKVLITVMQHHQRYFPVIDSTGNLMNRFIVVHNGNPEFEDIIREGNERVVRARLEDARFFYTEDLKIKLEERVPKLKGVVFQKKLGSLYEKTLRNVELVEFVARELGFSEETVQKAKRAAFLCKADLLTEMVNEFDELQGYMGKVYAERQGEPFEVASAIYEHYLPRFYGDEVPKTDAGRALAIADKLDTVTGYFLAGLEPTGSEDPYSLRRQAQGICLVVLESGLELNLKKAIEKSISLYEGLGGLLPPSEVSEKLFKFFEARFQRILSEKGYSQPVISAVIPQALENPRIAVKKADVLLSNLGTAELEDVVTAFQRVKNLSKPELGTEVNPSYLEEPEELELFSALEKIKEDFHKVGLDEQFKKLASLRPAVDRFFDGVLVMHEDLSVRENRLKLLNAAYQLFISFADFSFLK